MKTVMWPGLILAVALSSVGCRSAALRPAAAGPAPFATPSASAATNAVSPAGTWHSITVTPPSGLPIIHTCDKFNPVWWLKNLDDPVPPEWYRPEDRHRRTKWQFRNPFHNFDFYVIGVADKKFVRSGRYPERNSSPRGGWNFAVSRRKLALLPFISYDRGRFHFYLGWRERGNFGLKLNWSDSPKKTSKQTAAVAP